ncbi:MULE domain-containing protein [Fusarium sp. LHS14.1]|nr:MULE domain-containing protein [Fusarium sp. LHS14.1]
MAAIDDSHGFPEDALPPEGQFRSREELTAAINDWAAPRGYAFISQRSSKSISGRLTVTFACDRAGIPVATGKGVRKSASRRTGCLFSIIAKESICGTQWHIRHRPDPRSYSHNHAPSSTPMAHPVHRQLSRSDKATVRQMANAGIQPREIRSYLHETSDTLAMQQDIYNCIAQSKRDLAQGQSSIHALAAQLDDDGFWSKIQLDETGRVVAVIFAHPESLEYLKLYPEVLLLDFGVDACQRSFCVAFAFLSGEEEGDFAWALEQLRHIYELHSIALPSVILTDRCLACMNAISSPSCFPESALHLCMWHINKAILTHCQPAFARDKSNTQWQKEWDQFIDMWRKVTESTTEDIFNERLEKWRKQYLPQYLAEVGYIMETWVDPHKEKFVKAWVNRYLHLEQHVTSRAEGIHRLIKSHLKHNQINLFAAWRAIKLFNAATVKHTA